MTCCALAFSEFGQLHELSLPAPMVDEVGRSCLISPRAMPPLANDLGLRWSSMLASATPFARACVTECLGAPA